MATKDFDESLHPRDEGGRFTEGSGGVSGNKLVTGGKNPATSKLSLWGKVFGKKKANWKDAPKKLEGYTAAGVKQDERLAQLVHQNWEFLAALGADPDMSAEKQWEAFKTIKAGYSLHPEQTLEDTFKGYDLPSILKEVKKQDARAEAGMKWDGSDELEQRHREPGKFDFDDQLYRSNTKKGARDDLVYNRNELESSKRALAEVQKQIALRLEKKKTTGKDYDLATLRQEESDRKTIIAETEKRIKGLTFEIGTKFHDFRPKPGSGPRRGTDPIARPTKGLKESPFRRMGGDEKEILGLAQGPLLEKQFANAKLQVDLKAQMKPLEEERSKLREENNEIAEKVEAIVGDDDNFSRIGTHWEGESSVSALKPEKQKEYHDLDNRRTQIDRRLDEIESKKGELRGKLEAAQERNADAVAAYLGDIHTKCTDSWIHDVYTGYALKMQRAANEMGFKWAIGKGDGDEDQFKESEKGRIEESQTKHDDYAGQMREVKEYMRKEYNLSQASLRKDGYKPGDYITLYRGMKVGEGAEKRREELKGRTIQMWAKQGKVSPEDAADFARAVTKPKDIFARNLGKDRTKHKEGEVPEPKIHIEQRPLTSWTDKPLIATNYPGEHIITARVPIERVFSNYRLFKNTYDENEYVVLGATEVPSTIMSKADFTRKWKSTSETPKLTAEGLGSYKAPPEPKDPLASEKAKADADVEAEAKFKAQAKKAVG